MKYAAETTGCFIITKSRVSANTSNMNKVQESLDTFYKSEEKNQLGNVQAEGATRGFYPMGAETGDKSIFERKESFSFGYDEIPESFLNDCKLVANNMFPSTLKKENFNELTEDLNTTCMDILKLLQICYPDSDVINTVDKTSLFQSFTRSFRYYSPPN